MNKNEDFELTNLSKEDELSVRKILVEQMLETSKAQLKDKVMLLLAGAMDKDIETKSKGIVKFLERWIKDIDKEIYNSSKEKY